MIIPNSQRTKEELSANGRKGGLKSAASRRRKKEFRALLNEFLSVPVSLYDDYEVPTALHGALEDMGFKELTLKERGALLLAYKVSRGELRAALLVSKLIGEYSEDPSAELEDEAEPSPIMITADTSEEARDLEGGLTDFSK